MIISESYRFVNYIIDLLPIVTCKALQVWWFVKKQLMFQCFSYVICMIAMH